MYGSWAKIRTLTLILPSEERGQEPGTGKATGL